MAVTDLTDSLPWWTRAGAGPTGGPAATPQGGGVGGQPPPGMNQQAWLQYLMQMFNPGGSAQAMQQNGQEQQVPPDDHGDAPPGPVSPIAGQPPTNNFGNPPPANGPGPGNVGPVPLTPPGPSILPQARGAAVPPDQPTPPPAAGPSILPQARGVAVPPGPMAAGGSILPQGAAQASTPMGPPIPAGGVPGPLASGGATGMGATSNPRFIGISAPNASPQNSMRGGPQGTALNLAALFGGGQPAAPAASGAQNVPLNQTPMPPRRPTVPGPLANAPMPPTMPDDIRRQRAIQIAAARSGFA